TNGQSILVRFTCRFSVHCKLSHACGCPPLKVGLQARMCNDEPPIIEDIVAYKPIDEVSDSFLELLGFRFELFECLCQSVGDSNVTSTQFPQQFHIVVSG